jgi:polar amino acid transport system substrate-binding protein
MRTRRRSWCPTDGPWRHVAAVGVLVGLVVASSACGSTRDAVRVDLETVREGVLTVAADVPAPGFWEGEDAATTDGGFEWGLATALADRHDLRLEVVQVPFERIVSGEFGGADLALSQIGRTAERDEVLDFSIGYYTSDFGILVATDADEVTDLATGRDLVWAVADRTLAAEFLVDRVRPDTTARFVADEEAAWELVASGDVDAALVDLTSALVTDARRDDLRVTSRFLSDQQYAIALPTDSPNGALVDAALRAFTRDGTLDELEADWLLPRFATAPDRVPVVRVR